MLSHAANASTLNLIRAIAQPERVYCPCETDLGIRLRSLTQTPLSYHEALFPCPAPTTINPSRLPFDGHRSRSERQQLLRW